MSASLFELRAARPTDLVAVVALERATKYAPHWSPAVYATILGAQTPAQRCLIVAEHPEEDRGSIMGFAVGVIQPAAESAQNNCSIAELESVVVGSHCRRCGVGRSLCGAVIDWSRTNGAASVILEVRASSTGAIALYSGLGFVTTGRRPRYYREPKDDALNMVLALV